MTIQQNIITNPFSYGGGAVKFPIDTHAQVGSQIVFQAIRIEAPEAVSYTHLTLPTKA